MNKLTIFDWFGYELHYSIRYQLIKQAGFDGVLLWGDDESFSVKCPEIARANGLFVENVHTPFTDSANLWLDNLKGQDYVDKVLKCIDNCSSFEIPTTVVHLSKRDNNPPDNQLGLERVKRLVERAEAKNVTLALENQSNADYLRLVFNSVDSPMLKFCFDSGHQNCRTPEENWLAEYGHRLGSLHLHDNMGFRGKDEDDQHLLPFDGNIDWPSTMKKIKSLGYDGPIALEVVNTGYEKLKDEHLEFLKIAYERGKSLCELMN